MAKKTGPLYVRNARPNLVILKNDGLRIPLERRGNRADSAALDESARANTTIKARLTNGSLEEITEEQFNKLATRQIDLEPNQYLKRPIRNPRRADLKMHPAESDTTKTPTAVVVGDVRKSANPALEWNGELMSTAEELDELDYTAEQQNYPSHHRDEDNTRAMGY